MFSLVWPDRTYEKEEEYFYKIYIIVKDKDFNYGKVNDGKLILYDKTSIELLTLPLPELNEKITFKSVTKDTAAKQIYFIMGGSVDDNYGILFTYGSSVNMEGLYSIKRIGGNSYYYETFK